MYSRPDREAQSEREEDKPDAGSPGIGVDALTWNAPTRIKMTARMTISTLIRSSRAHGTWPLFVEKAATSQ